MKAERRFFSSAFFIPETKKRACRTIEQKSKNDEYNLFVYQL
jgi:hypothetical protein